MRYLTLTRFAYLEACVLGRITMEFHLPIYTLERPWRFNQVQTSCIPEGDYLLKPHKSEKFPAAWEVTGVSGRTAILIHPANAVKELQGCIAPGLEYSILKAPNALKYQGRVGASRAAYARLDTWIKSMAEPVTLRIRSERSRLIAEEHV